MPLKKSKKQAIKKDYGLHEKDSGSAEVQIGLLTKEIDELSRHLTNNRQDTASRRGLLRKVSKRRRLLRYLEKSNKKSYEKIIKKIKKK